MIVNIAHTLNPDFTMIGSPIKLSDTPVQYKSAPPQLGEHTQTVLSQFVTLEQLNALTQRNILG